MKLIKMDTLAHLATGGTVATLGGIMIPPPDSSGQILHLIVGVITAIMQLVVIFKKPKQ